MIVYRIYTNENNRILLVCGAPGTGKTLFLAKLACHAVAVMNWKVLICAPTNQAADVCTHALLSTAAVDKVMIATEGPKEGFTNMEVVRLLVSFIIINYCFNTKLIVIGT